MTSLLASVVATIALAADPGLQLYFVGPEGLADIIRLGTKDIKLSPTPGNSQKAEEDAFWNAMRYDRLPILGPIQPGAPEIGFDAPSAEEVLRKLEKARPTQGGTASLDKVERKNVRIVTEPIQDSVDPPRVMPRVGPVQVHNIHFKCTVYFTEVTHVRGPTPHTTVDEDCQEVIYIDRDHLHRVGKAESPERPVPSRQ